MKERHIKSRDGIAPDMDCYQFSDGEWRGASVAIPREIAFTIFVNNQELVTTLCTPTKLNCLVLGFLFSEGIISGMDDVVSMRVCEDELLADVRLNRSDFTLPNRRVLTSGCGGGVSFSTTTKGKVNSDLKVMPVQILSLMKQLLEGAEIYKVSGGIHTSALCDKENILVMAEDIGRHNTLDKLQGECLLRKLSTEERILITSGRLSSEMLRKASKMQIPIIASLTSPTENAVVLAREAGISLIGYARGRRLSVYSCPERLISEKS